MSRVKPHVTGIAMGLAVAVWIGTRNSQVEASRFVRGVFAGLGIAAIVTSSLQRFDESADSRRSYRHAKSRYLEALAVEITRNPADPGTSERVESSNSDTPEWLTMATETTVHFDESFLDEPPIKGVDRTSQVITSEQDAVSIDPRVAFGTAIADGAWIVAFEALRTARENGTGFEPGPELSERLRKGSMEEIFQRMHSGTVREDVAKLAQDVVESFPDTTEGRTLSQVLGVLRRSAGLCPRCAEPYRGIASACHACLRGTPEAYQIAWDEDSDGTASPE